MKILQINFVKKLSIFINPSLKIAEEKFKDKLRLVSNGYVQSVFHST